MARFQECGRLEFLTHHRYGSQRCVSREHRDDVTHREIGHRQPRLAGGAAEVRREHGILERQQFRVHCWFAFEHVECRPRDQPFTQRPRERGLVDDRSARRVHQIRRAFHAREGPLVDQLPRVGGQRHVQADDVGCGEQAIERHRLGRGPVHRPPAADGHAHPEGRRPIGDRAADPARTDHPQLLAAQARAQHEIERPPLPRAPANDALALTQPPRDGQDQGPRVVGDRVGQHVRRVGAHDPFRACVGDVQVVVTDRHVRDHFQVGTRVDRWGIQPVAEEHDDALLPAQPIVQLAWCEARLAHVHIHLETLLEQRQRSSRQPAGHEHGGAHPTHLRTNRPVSQAAAAAVDHGIIQGSIRSEEEEHGPSARTCGSGVLCAPADSRGIPVRLPRGTETVRRAWRRCSPDRLPARRGRDHRIGLRHPHRALACSRVTRRSWRAARWPWRTSGRTPRRASGHS